MEWQQPEPDAGARESRPGRHEGPERLEAKDLEAERLQTERQRHQRDTERHREARETNIQR